MLEGDDLNQKEGYEIYEPVYEDTTDESDESDWKTDRSETLLHNFQDLPDEIILKVLSYSEPNDLISSCQVSKRLRKISHDNSLWQNVFLALKFVKTEFLALILDKGCKSLSLSGVTILGSLFLQQKSQLRILDLSELVENSEVLKVMLASCYSLQALEIHDNMITPEIATSICQNGKTLQKLDLDDSIVDQAALMQIIRCCQELKEVNLADVINNREDDLSDDCLEFIAKHLCPNIEILDISDLRFVDNHFKILFNRCNKIKELTLRSVELSNNSLTIIRENLSLTLEKLSLDYSDELSLIDFLERKSMPRLKFIFFEDEEDGDEAIENLRKQLPHLRINVGFLSSKMVVDDENAYLGRTNVDFKPFISYSDSTV